MKTPHENNFVSCSDDNGSFEVSEEQDNDPFKGINSGVTETFYKLDDIVFAEPLNTTTQFKNTNERSEDMEICEIDDNITVLKRRNKKYRKFLINLPDIQNPICPHKNCSKSFSTLTLLKAHIRKVHCTTTGNMCEQCGASFKSPRLLSRHASVHVNKRAQCPVCHRMLSYNTNMAQHLRSHSNTRPHKCEVCEKTFLRKSTLDVHVRFVHRKGDLICEKCNVRFSSRGEWNQHDRSHRKMSSSRAS